MSQTDIDKAQEAAKEKANKELVFKNEIIALVNMPMCDFGEERKRLAEKYGLKQSEIDAQVKEYRQDEKSEQDTGTGREIKLYEPEPWPVPVNGSDILEEAASIIKRHMVMSQADIYACVLWAAHTYLFKHFAHTPRLLITAPDAECGKTLLMTHMVGNLVNKPQPVEMMSPAPFFRLAEKYQPCFLIDEADIFFRADSDLPAAINGGWEPHGGVPRCVGEDNEVRIFSTHCPAAMAGINLQTKLPPSTISRCIVISLDRAIDIELKDEDTYTASRHKKNLITAGRKLARWANDNKEKIKQIAPSLPHGVRNRSADKWSPLFSIAEAAGGVWPEHAAIALRGQIDLAEPSKAQILLADIHEVIKRTPDANISTVILIDKLCKLDDSPWREYNFKNFEEEKRKISARQLSGLLKRYKIKNQPVRIGDKVSKGYKGKELTLAYERYAINRHVPPDKRVTRLQSPPDMGYSDSEKVTKENHVTDKKHLKSPPDAKCNLVTDNIGGSDDIEEDEQEKPRYSEVI